jgi:hypothetical protein
MIQFFIDRAGKNLFKGESAELERANRVLDEMNAKRRGKPRSSDGG